MKINQYLSEKGHYEIYIADIDNKLFNLELVLKNVLKNVKDTVAILSTTERVDVVNICKKTLISLHKKYKLIKNTVKEELLKRVPYSVFKKVLSIHNKAIVSKMIHEGYQYTFPNKMGIYRIINKPIKPKIKNGSIRWPIDWPASNKLKKELLDAGETLYNKDTDPDGKKWLVKKVTGMESWFHWYFGGVNLSNRHFFKFYPSIGANGITRKLKKLTRINPSIRDKYVTI